MGADGQSRPPASAHRKLSDRLDHAPAADRLCGEFQPQAPPPRAPFQNRYKSILCEEDAYLGQLVAYIHLNPLQAGIVEDLSALKAYRFTGHSALMGREERPWQDSRYVLALFGRGLSEARRNLQRHVAKWALKGRCPELTGGGLIRSSGGWRAVKEAYQEGIRLASDERILGSSEFVERTLKKAGEEHTRRARLCSAGIDLDSVVEHCVGISAWIRVNWPVRRGVQRLPARGL